jgi:hypothetical protein
MTMRMKSFVITNGVLSLFTLNFSFLWSMKWPKSMWNNWKWKGKVCENWWWNVASNKIQKLQWQ